MLPWAPKYYRVPVIPMLQPAGENRNARPLKGQRTTDNQPLIRQLIIFRMAVPFQDPQDFFSEQTRPGLSYSRGLVT